jgi:hypothetical protein
MTASAKRPRYQSKHIEVPLADELFECIQGPFKSFVDLVTPEGQPYNAYYHTYSNVIHGDFDDRDTEMTLRLAFETYLRRLRESVAPREKKPQLFWRFRKGEHILIEAENRRGSTRVKLYTRLVVPDSSLVMCPTCLHTEGEEHAAHCANVVKATGDQVHA